MWELRNENYDQVSTFEEMVEIDKYFFENMFKSEQHALIAEVIQISQLFPRRISDEDNSDLMEEVSKDKLKAALQSFQRDQSPGSDGWTMELFLASYDTIGPDLLHLVE